MVNVELIYDSDCPNVTEAKKQLKEVLIKVGLEPRWQEWERSDPKSPHYVRRYASPTILVNGKDVAGFLPGDTVRGCRIYSDVSGKSTGVPSQETITSALLRAEEKGSTGPQPISGNKGKWWAGFSVFPVIGAALLPAIGCPACWPAYAGLLSLIGLRFVNYTPYLFPLTVLCLVVVLLPLGFRARRRSGFGPLVLGSAAALFVLIGKFIFAWKAVTYGGVIILIAASIWNLWPRKTAGGAICPDCVPAAAPQTELEHRPISKGS